MKTQITLPEIENPLRRLMKNFTPAGVGFLLVVALITFATFQTSFASEPPARDPAADKGMKESCRAMKGQKREMMAAMQAQDTALTDAVAKMNAATGAEKTAQMAAIITTLVEQRTAMRTGMAKLQEDMMRHMMDHMQAGKDSMMGCPMMKADEEKAPDSHQGHH